jgi:hypothetical protein
MLFLGGEKYNFLFPLELPFVHLRPAYPFPVGAAECYTQTMIAGVGLVNNEKNDAVCDATM